MRLAKEEGFTLVEVMVTMLVLGVLAGIAVLSLTSARNTSVQNACKTSAQALILAVSSYRSDNSGALPTELSAGTSVLASAISSLTNASTVTVNGVSTTYPPYVSNSLLTANDAVFKLGLQKVTADATNPDGFIVTVYNSSGTQLTGSAPTACASLA